jgi:hypothetical protein
MRNGARMTAAASGSDVAELGPEVALGLEVVELGEDVAAADDAGATARTQRAKPIMSPSGFVLRYSSHWDNKGMTEEAKRPIRTILL